MSTARLLRKLGILVIEDFLSPSECDAICEEMRIASKSTAGAYSKKTNSESIAPTIRQTQYCDISKTSRKKIATKIQSLKPTIELFFNTQLSEELEPPKYLLYEKGSFFSPHTDDQLNRRINITINLNSKLPSEKATEYEGGDLQLYGLLKGQNFVSRGIAAPSTTGCLTAYPVNIVHEVMPITAGSRYSIVTRFLS